MVTINHREIGLSESDVTSISAVFARHTNIEKAILYGSRAMGNYKPASDIDICLLGCNIDLTQLNEIENEIDDLYLPYKFDISALDKIENPDLLKHIKRLGKEFYKIT